MTMHGTMPVIAGLCRPSGPAWHVVYTEPGADRVIRDRDGEDIGLSAELRKLGFDVYQPIERGTRIQRRRRVEIVRPLFSRYLFAAGGDWRDLLDVEGVADVLRNNDVPSRVPGAWIDALRKAEGVGAFDRRKNAPTPFQIGEIVRVSEGPFSGFNARIESFVAKLRSTTAHKRAKVLLDFLGQQARMEVDLVALERL